MTSVRRAADIDWEVVAANVRGARKSEGLSQTELARRSGVNLASVYRIERAKPTHLRTARSIARGLNIVFEDLLLQKSVLSGSTPVAVHRAGLAKWFSAEDSRTRLPADHVESYQQEAERQRLGKLGFVPFFMCPPLIIPPNGPGLVVCEIFSTLRGPFNEEFYMDGALYVLRGRVTCRVDSETRKLDEGDWAAFRCSSLEEVAVVAPCEQATILWIGATRVKRNRK